MGDAFKALADPTRRRILELLAQGDLTAGEIAAHFDMTKPSVSHHLNILRSAALIHPFRTIVHESFRNVGLPIFR